MLATIREYLDIDKRYAPDAFEHAIDKEQPLNLPDGSKSTYILRKVAILDEGRCAELTMEFPDELRSLILGDFDTFSIKEQ